MCVRISIRQVAFVLNACVKRVSVAVNQDRGGGALQRRAATANGPPGPCDFSAIPPSICRGG